MSLLYRAEGLERIYAGRRALVLPFFSVDRGEIVALTGPNGAGKSTLLRLLAFLEDSDGGSLLFRGSPGVPPRHEATLLLQEPYLLKRSVLENVAYGLRVRGLSACPAEPRQGALSAQTRPPICLRERVAAVLEQVGFAPSQIIHRPWYELSGGEKQRVALAARLILQPLALLLDEPTSSVDSQSAAAIRAAVHKAAAAGTTVIIASHDVAWLGSVQTQALHLEPQG